MASSGKVSEFVSKIRAESEEELNNIEKELYRHSTKTEQDKISIERLQAKKKEFIEMRARGSAFHIGNNFCPYCFIVNNFQSKLAGVSVDVEEDYLRCIQCGKLFTFE